MAKKTTKFVCQTCGTEFPKWMGKCSGCGEWNTLVEERVITGVKGNQRGWLSDQNLSSKPRPITEVETTSEARFSTGVPELDRVLGGGIVPGSLGLLGGEPGIGKSTLLMQVAAYVATHRGKVLYVSGEESLSQLKLRAKRLHLLTDQLVVAAEANAETIGEYIEKLQPQLVLIDSIQTIYHEGLNSAPGSVGQVREGASFFLKIAKTLGIPMVLVGHVTKGGSFAGPKVLEHAVDYVLYFEGENHQSYRIIRGVKNRFGSTNEVGIFEMTDKGLTEVDNPSGLFLAGRPIDCSGSVVVPCMEGTRPLLVEVQSLVAPSPFGGTPRRQTTGVDYQRFSIILAVLEKRQGYPLQSHDVFVNAAGGFRLTEPGADLGIACAVASSVRNQTIDPSLAVIGEVGLSGEIRAVSQLELRLNELAKLGFKHAVIPAGNSGVTSGLPVSKASTISEALKIIFTN